MIVIEGRGRAKKLERFLNMDLMASADDVAILDSAETVEHLLITDGYHIYPLVASENNHIEDIKIFKDIYDTKLNRYDWIIFYPSQATDKKQALEDFKNLDREYPQNFVVVLETEGNIQQYLI